MLSLVFHRVVKTAIILQIKYKTQTSQHSLTSKKEEIWGKNHMNLRMYNFVHFLLKYHLFIFNYFNDVMFLVFSNPHGIIIIIIIIIIILMEYHAEKKDGKLHHCA
jgi:hypothetical protein